MYSEKSAPTRVVQKQTSPSADLVERPDEVRAPDRDREHGDLGGPHVERRIEDEGQDDRDREVERSQGIFPPANWAMS